MKVERDMPTLNVISFVLYYGTNLIGLLLFNIILLPIWLVFGWFFPVFFRNLGVGIDAYIRDKIKQVDDDWDRLSTIEVEDNDV